MPARDITRRRFVQTAALTSVGAGLVPRAASASEAKRVREKIPFTLGVATFSLRNFDRTEAISMIQALHVRHISVKSFHMPYEDSPEELAAGVQAFARAGIEIVSGGNNGISKDNDDHVRMFFDYAKAVGIPLLVIAPTVKNMPRIERFVKEYDIQVAIHNHGPEDPHFPGPRDALEVIRDMDPRVGVCIDIGHTARTGVDVVEACAEAGDRLLDIHMKDLRDVNDRSSQCIVGEGVIPVADIFRQLVRMDYRGYMNLEYEIDANDPLPGMKQSFAYMRGVLDGMSA